MNDELKNYRAPRQPWSWNIVALSIAFALGALVALDAHYRHATPCKPDAVAPKLIKPKVRAMFPLTHPLSCEHGWVRNCPDFKPCQESCR